MTDVFNTMIDDLLDDANLASAATFTASGGSPVSCSVFFDQESYIEPGAYESSTWRQRKTVEVVASTLGGTPAVGDTFVIDGTTYTVTEQIENDGYTVKVVVK